MARPQKRGLDYFPLDVDFFEDDKIQLLESEHGVKGAYIAVRLLCAVYRNGYYYQWGDDECRLFARKTCGAVTPTEVADVVSTMLRRAIFDEGMYALHGILTSRGIQERYTEIVSRTKRLGGIDKKFDLTGQKTVSSEETAVYSEETQINSEETPINSEFSTQRKEKKRKIDNGDGLNLAGARARTREGDAAVAVGDFIESAKTDGAYIADVAQVTHLGTEAVAEMLPDYAAQCRLDGKDMDTRKGHMAHFRNFAGKRARERYRVEDGPTVRMARPQAVTSASEYTDREGNRRCSDTNAIIPPDATPRPCRGTYWCPVPRKWLPFGT